MISRLRTYRTLFCASLILLGACNKTPEHNADTGIKLMFIGQITDTANATSIPEAAAGATAAVARINANGGLFGKAITLLICDDKADANEAAKCARKAVREQVAAVVGSNTNHGNVILPILANANIMSLGQNPITAQDFANPTSFPLQGGAPTAVIGTAKLLVQQGARKIRLATVDSLAGSLSEGFAKQGLANTEAEFMGITLIPVGAPDYAGYAASLISDSDGIIISTNADQAARIVMALRQAGATQKIALPALALPPATLAQLGNKAEGLLLASTDKPTASTDRSQYEQDMNQYANSAKRTAFALRSWLAVTVFDRVLRKAAPEQGRNVDAKTILALFEQLEGQQVSDLIPTLTTTQTLAAPFNRLFINKVMYARIVNGEMVLIDEQWY